MSIPLTPSEQAALKLFRGKTSISHAPTEALEGLEMQGAVVRSGSKWTLTEAGDDELESRFPGGSVYYAKRRKKTGSKKRAKKKAKKRAKKRTAKKRTKKRGKKKRASKRGKGLFARAHRAVKRAVKKLTKRKPKKKTPNYTAIGGHVFKV